MSAATAHAPTQSATDSFGCRLRSERERRRISLEVIAANTKIGIALLRGLEKDDVSRWPSGIFRRAFIRAYAEAIGLDADEVVREFQERFPDPLESVAGIGPETVRPGATPSPDAVLRLTLADVRPPFWGGRILPALRRRLAAAAWDVGTLLALAVTGFIVFDQFWMTLGIASVGYYAGGILLLGNTPGVCLFAPRAKTDEDDDPRGDPVDEVNLLDGLRSDPAVLLNLDRIGS